MCINKKDFGDIIRDDELVSDFEFRNRILIATLIEDARELPGEKWMIYSGIF
jgi:hypothetical protein